MASKSVLITGCSAGGIGHALAISFQKRGFTVFASARSVKKMESLGSLPNVHLVSLDVTLPDSIAAAAAEISTKTGGKLDVLINNAGAEFIMPVLDVDIDAAKALFEVNYWALIRMVQAFWSMLAAAKGCVVNVASVAGVNPIPFQSQYGASKAAVVNLSETMRLELAPLGVRVITVMAGGTKSNIFENNPTPRTIPRTSPYLSIEKEFAIDPDLKPIPAEKFAEQVVDDVVRGATGKVWHGSSARTTRYLVPVMPQWLFDRIMISFGRGLQNVRRP